MSPVDTVRGRVDGDGRLVEADAPLIALNARAGGAVGTAIAIPQVASLVRLARRLNILVSRAVVVADGEHDLDLWVRARPEGEGVALAIGGWTLRPAPAPAKASSAERNHDFNRSSADWLWETDEALCLISLQPAGGGIDPATVIGQPLTKLFRLFEIDGEMPAVLAMAGHRRFAGQPAEMRPTSARVLLSAVPLIDGAGRFVGYRGSAIVDGEALVEPRRGSDDAFGERLDAALRQPLGRIVASAEELRARPDGPLRADYADYANDIASAGRHLLALVDDLVDLQAIERTDFRPRAEPLELAELARSAAGLLAVRASDRGIRIDTPAEDEQAPATGDYRRTLQVLVNLVGNAVRHSPEGGMVWVRSEPQRDMAVVIVADQGRGIAPGDHERIFEKFVRVAPDDGPGSGLGLYIARRLARAMGGDIVVDSAPGQGARFMFTLPSSPPAGGRG